VGDWGVRWPIRPATFATEQQRLSQTPLKQASVFCCLSVDSLPRIAPKRMRDGSPELRFEMKAGYLERIKI